VSRLALGTAFYAWDSRDKWFEILDRFAELGGTLLDTGRVYGTSEKVLGEWIASRGMREGVILTTKCGCSGGARPDGLMPVESFEQMVTEELETSLRHLRTDYVDLYMLHRDNPGIPVAKIMGPLNERIQRGHVRALGASNWTYARLDEANAWARQHGLVGFAVASNNIALAMPAAPFYPGLVSIDVEGERWHLTTGIPLIAWSAQARGFFTGRYTPAMRHRLAEVADGFERRMLEVYGTDENFERLRRAQDLGQRHGGYSAVQIALAWLLHKPFALVPIVGPHTTNELESCAEALSLRLPEAELRWLNLEAAGWLPHGTEERNHSEECLQRGRK
jgi:aryl-alcohol dehydrogenase-like predicted oxidoreductase